MKRIAAIACTMAFLLLIPACGEKDSQTPNSQITAEKTTTQPTVVQTEEITTENQSGTAKAAEEKSATTSIKKSEATTVSTTKKPAASNDHLSASYVNIMKTGKFLIRYKVTQKIEGVTMNAEITTASDGKAIATIMKSNGMNSHTIMKDNLIYMLDDESKTYYKMDLSMGGDTNEDLFEDTEDLKYTGKGTAKVNGKTLPYEEYKTDGETMRFFMDGKKLYAITSKIDNEETVMVILELTGTIPSGMLSIPKGYKEQSMPDLSDFQ